MATEGHEIDASLRLAEQHHRTQNLFQLTNVVLGNAARAASPESADCLRKVQVQLDAFAALNELLYQGTAADARMPCCSAFLSTVSDLLRVSCLDPRGIALRVRWPKELPASAAACRHLALIMTELVFNAAKHAFPNRGGMIRIVLEEDGPGLRLSVTDNGIGMPSEATQGTGKGRSFIEVIAKAINAAIDVRSSSDGTLYLIAVASRT